MSIQQYIDIREFREAGYLQEVNRCFLHLLGLALEISIKEDGTEYISGIQDSRDDSEGMAYEDSYVSSPEALEKAERVLQEISDKIMYRRTNLGYSIQPIPNLNGDGDEG